MTRVVLHPAARKVGELPGVVEGLERVASQVADRAEAGAPKRTGRGARSIHHEIVRDAFGVHARVSWSPDAFYLYFHEVGTSKMPGRPFLRPALDGTYTP